MDRRRKNKNLVDDLAKKVLSKEITIEEVKKKDREINANDEEKSRLAKRFENKLEKTETTPTNLKHKILVYRSGGESLPD